MNELKQKKFYNKLETLIKKWMSIEGVSPSNYKSYLFELLENEIITEEEYHELRKASI